MKLSKPILLAALAAISLSGCAELKGRKKVATGMPIIETVTPPAPPNEVTTPKPVAQTPARSCVPRTVSASPRYPDSDAALRDAPGAADRYQLMAAGRLLRQKRLDELERVVAGCR